MDKRPNPSTISFLAVASALSLSWADPASAAEADNQPSPSQAKPSRDSEVFGGRRWSFGVLGGYYGPTSTIAGLKVNPLGPTVGGSVSYTTKSGAWFGLQGQYFPGRTISQVYEPPLTNLVIEIDAETQLTSLGGTVGYDFSLGPVVIRYALELGVSLVTWDFGDIPYLSLAGFSPMSGTSAAPYMAPGGGVVLPLGPLFVGAEFRYRIEVGPNAPSAAGGQLHTGVRF